jgi:hypothetical protein
VIFPLVFAQEIQNFLMPFPETFTFAIHHHSSLLPKRLGTREKSFFAHLCYE